MPRLRKPNFAALLTILAATACTPQPRWQVAPAGPSALARIDRAAIFGMACRADRQSVPCGDYLLARLVPMLERRPDLRDLSIADASAACRPEGRGTVCELSARVLFMQDGRTWPLRVDMRYRAPEHVAYSASARSAASRLADSADPSLAPLRDVLDRLVASIALESDRAARIRAS